MAVSYILRYQTLDGSPKVVPLQGTDWTLGRSSENRIVLDDPTVSRNHAVLRLLGESFFIRELSPRNPILDGNQRPLFPGGDPNQPSLKEARVVLNRPLLLGSTWIWLEKQDTAAVTTLDTKQLLELKAAAPTQEDFTILREWVDTLKPPSDHESRATEALNLLASLVPYRRGVVALLEEDEHLRILASLQPGQPGSVSRPEMLLNDHLIKQLSQRRTPILVADSLTEPGFQDRQAILALGIRSFLAVPLVWEEEVHGLIYLDRGRKEPPFTSTNEDIASIVGQFLAYAVQNRDLEKATRQIASPEESSLPEGPSALEPELTGDVVGSSRVFLEHLSTLRSVADHDVSLLIMGESGSGKEIAARLVHLWSRRASGPFVTINCAALQDALLEMELFGYGPKASVAGMGAAQEGKAGRIQQADQGTLFLDEIGDLSLRAQARLLRVLESQEVEPLGGERPVQVNVRLIAASSKDLKSLLDDGLFRQDLYYRLASFVVQVPPLRDRGDDVMTLARTFLVQKADSLGILAPRVSPAAGELLVTYPWPGNIRELKHFMEQAITMGARKLVTPEDLPKELRQLSPPVPLVRLPLSTVEANHIEKVLAFCRGNVRMAARVLGIATSTLYEKIKRYGLEGDVIKSRKHRRALRAGIDPDTLEDDDMLDDSEDVDEDSDE